MSNHSATGQGVSNAWDFYLSQHEVSVPATIREAITDAFTQWLNAHEHTILEILTTKTRKAQS